MPSELITIDENYLSRIEIRRSILATHPSTVHGCLPEGAAPVRELYSFLLAYLPQRYPNLFTLRFNTFSNNQTDATHPFSPPDDPLYALQILAKTVEDDLFLLIETPEGHRCVAFACCFPSGFDPSTKLGKVLAQIHEPVPGYEKIRGSMERFFKRLEVGKSVKRVNVCELPVHGPAALEDSELIVQWFITTGEDLFNPGWDPADSEKDVDIETV